MRTREKVVSTGASYRALPIARATKSLFAPRLSSILSRAPGPTNNHPQPDTYHTRAMQTTTMNDN